MSFVLSSILPKDNVLTPVLCYSKKKIFELISKQASTCTNIPSSQLFKMLMDREELGTTFLNNSIAIPHATIPNNFNESAVFIISTKPIDYTQSENSSVDIFFALFLHHDTIINNNSTINEILNELSSQNFVKQLKTIKNIPNQVYELLLSLDKK